METLRDSFPNQPKIAKYNVNVKFEVKFKVLLKVEFRAKFKCEGKV